jgi:hypothetical protein
MSQLDLFAPPAKLYRGEVACTRPTRGMVRNTDPETSQLAAESVLSAKASGQQIALKWLTWAGADGLSDFELAAWAQMQQTSIGKRRGELVDLGLVQMLEVDGKPVRRPAPSGRLAQVWTLSPAGAEHVWSGAS